MIPSIADVCDHALERVSVKVAPAHLNDRAEAAIVSTPARSLYHIDLPAQHRVATEYARFAVRCPYLSAVKTTHFAVFVVAKPVASSECQSGNLVECPSVFDCP